MEKLRCLVFKSMAHELEGPSQKKKSESNQPETMEENAGEEDNDGEQYKRYAQRMAGAVDGILMAGRILRNPLLAAASAQHGRDHTPVWGAVLVEKRMAALRLIEALAKQSPINDSRVAKGYEAEDHQIKDDGPVQPV
jgi:hypothetical protein